MLLRENMNQRANSKTPNRPEDRTFVGIDTNTIVILLNCHGSILNSCIDLRRYGIDFFQKINKGEAGCVNISAGEDKEFVWNNKKIDFMKKKTNTLNGMKVNFVDFFRETHKKFKYNADIRRIQANVFKYMTKTFKYHGTHIKSYIYNSSNRENQFILNKHLSASQKDINFQSGLLFKMGIFVLYDGKNPTKKGYMMGGDRAFDTTLMKLIEYITSIGYSKIIIYDTSCNTFSEKTRRTTNDLCSNVY